ncbi:hypothetical protein [Peribacillus frigoritolerans]|uniref:hypothetical protein n=1 Tax=Peribacillus frigoritolerans TaxID=450367 RepID=UPI002EA1A73C|nr:hypothetical protein [Peribacillus frigoritolerans]
MYEWVSNRKKPTFDRFISLVLMLIRAMFAADVFQGKLTDFKALGLFLGLCSAFTYAGVIYASGKVSVEVSPWLRSPIMVTGSMILVFILFPNSNTDL